MARPYFLQTHVLRQFFATAIISLCFMGDGMQFGWMSPAAKYLNDTESRIVGYNNDISTAIQIIFLIGGILCTPLVTFLADRIGRKWTSIVGSSVNLVSWISIGLTTYAEVLIFSKLLASISYCFDMIILPMYVSEISEKRIRGFFLGHVMMSAMVGIVLIYIIFPLMPVFVSSMVGGSLNVIHIVIFIFMPDSPYYLVNIGKGDKAAKSLQYFRGDEDVTAELKEIEEALAAQKESNAKLKDLFKDDVSRKALAIGCVLQFMVPLGLMSALTMNIHSLLSDDRILFPEGEYYTGIAFAGTLAIGQLICMLIIDYFGRKPLLLFSIILCNLMLFSFATYLTVRDFHPDGNYTYAKWIPEVAVIVYALCYRQGFGSVPSTICAEIFPIKHKAIGLSIAFVVLTIFDTVSVAVITQIGKVMKTYYSFYIFIGISTLCIPFVIFLVPETKGKTLEEIHENMSKGWIKKKAAD